MLAVGSLSYALGKQFIKYLPTFVQYLKMGLTNYQEWQVCGSMRGGLLGGLWHCAQQVCGKCIAVYWAAGEGRVCGHVAG